MEGIRVAMVCKLMAYYRLGIFQKLSTVTEKYIFDFYGDTAENAGIKQIPYSYSTAPKGKKIRWIKTKNIFYQEGRLLWQTNILKEIFSPKYKVFVFEGAIAHLPVWLFALLCKINNKKVIYWTHGNKGLDKGLKKFLRKILFQRLGDGLFLYGNEQKKNMIEDGYDPKTIQVIYNSLQPYKQFEILEHLSSTPNICKLNIFKNPDNFTLIFIGRLVADKGVLTILKAMKNLKRDSIFLNCIFVGKGAEKQKMLNYCRDNDLEDYVHFAGELYDEEKIAPYFVNSDLLVSPGNVGLNCIHSLAYGVPVLTHDNFKFQNPEVEAIEDKKTGIFYNYNDFDDLLVKLKDWINKYASKSFTSYECQKIIKEKYNPDYQSKCIISGLDKVLNCD